jgi:predicted nucleotidyltransferase
MNKKSISKLKAFYKKNSGELLDIILFGSTIRGKDKPNDMDIILIFRNKESEETSYNLRKLLEDENPEIISKKYDTMFQDNFIAKEAILKEGFSIAYNDFLSKKAGYNNLMLFKYDLKKLSKSKKISFYYSLYGRNGNEGILNRLKLIKFTESTILCPMENSEEAKTYFEQHKIDFETIPILIPSRLV